MNSHKADAKECGDNNDRTDDIINNILHIAAPYKYLCFFKNKGHILLTSQKLSQKQGLYSAFHSLSFISCNTPLIFISDIFIKLSSIIICLFSPNLMKSNSNT